MDAKGSTGRVMRNPRNLLATMAARLVGSSSTSVSCVPQIWFSYTQGPWVILGFG